MMKLDAGVHGAGLPPRARRPPPAPPRAAANLIFILTQALPSLSLYTIVYNKNH